jgi:hypothetical protein
MDKIFEEYSACISELKDPSCCSDLIRAERSGLDSGPELEANFSPQSVPR